MSKAISINNFPGYYITDVGDVYSRKTYNNQNGRIRKLKPSISKDGYLRICLQNKGIKKSFLIHRLVADAFIPNLSGNTEINHKNGTKSDNSVSNLERISHQENIKHAYSVLKKGTRKVLCVEKNKTFNAIVDAARFFDVAPQSIGCALYNPKWTSCGCHWKYVD